MHICVCTSLFRTTIQTGQVETIAQSACKHGLGQKNSSSASWMVYTGTKWLATQRMPDNIDHRSTEINRWHHWSTLHRFLFKKKQSWTNRYLYESCNPLQSPDNGSISHVAQDKFWSLWRVSFWLRTLHRWNSSLQQNVETLLIFFSSKDHARLGSLVKGQTDVELKVCSIKIF